MQTPEFLTPLSETRYVKRGLEDLKMAEDAVPPRLALEDYLVSVFIDS